jgi:hypothetical protein
MWQYVGRYVGRDILHITPSSFGNPPVVHILSTRPDPTPPPSPLSAVNDRIHGGRLRHAPRQTTQELVEPPIDRIWGRRLRGIGWARERCGRYLSHGSRFVPGERLEASDGQPAKEAVHRRRQPVLCNLWATRHVLKSNFQSWFLPLDFRNTTGSITNATSRLLRCCERLLTLCSAARCLQERRWRGGALQAALGVQQQRFSELYPFGSVLTNSSLLTSIPVNTMVPTRMKKRG